MAFVLDGTKIAADVRRGVAERVSAFVKKHGRAPSLHVVLAGDDPASAIYVRNKEKAAREVGIGGDVHRVPATTTQAELVSLVKRLNDDEAIDGILVQLPLPKGIDEQAVLDLVDPKKDVDGFHPVNAGLLAVGRKGLVPCTPVGCLHLVDIALRELGRTLEGARAVVVGRSNIVGKPMAQLLLRRSATVTIAHSRTSDLAAVCREADVLVVAVGKADLVRREHVKPGAIVIDVGMNRLAPDAEGGKGKLVGDVRYGEVAEVAGAITPVPGGVGPMTIAMLLENTVTAAEARIA
jgi:methylenetetrahydrofolate dehydrogenase (NADP+)/methenyltetrahydrofolate cyclohydrolase